MIWGLTISYKDKMTEKEKMISGKIYDPSDKELTQLRQNAHRLCTEYNVLNGRKARRGAEVTRDKRKRVLFTGTRAV